MRTDSLAYRTALRLSKKMYAAAEMVVTATNGLKDCIEVLAEGNKVAVCYNGYPDFMQSIRAENAERFTVFFHGVLGFFQDVEGLVEIARKLEGQGIDVLAIGYGRKEHLVTDGAPANLRFLGKLSLRESLIAVAGAHVGICMRTDDKVSKDAFPVKIFECLGAGISVPVSPFCEGGAFVEERECGKQFSVADREGIVAEILKLSSDPAHYAAHVQNARHTAVNLSRGSLGKQYAELLYEVIETLQ